MAKMIFDERDLDLPLSFLDIIRTDEIKHAKVSAPSGAVAIISNSNHITRKVLEENPGCDECQKPITNLFVGKSTKKAKHFSVYAFNQAEFDYQNGKRRFRYFKSSENRGEGKFVCYECWENKFLPIVRAEERKNQALVISNQLKNRKGRRIEAWCKKDLQEYKRLLRVDMEEFFTVLKTCRKEGRKKAMFAGYQINMTSDRYINFLENGTECSNPHCHHHGMFFYLERNGKSESEWDESVEKGNGHGYHFNLYYERDDGELVMMTKDHVVPKSKGGKNHIDNYQVLCAPCNKRKAAMSQKDWENYLSLYCGAPNE